MRLVLLPISSKRTLLYCIRTTQATPGRPLSFVDKTTARVAKVWADWERKESGWQRKVVEYGNHALRRIPYQEWGLKSVPPLSARRRSEELTGKDKVELVFPGSVLGLGEAEKVLHRLGSERDALHRMRLMWCFIGMPITAPVALIPVIPNLPFFYLVYRAWSHWRAIKGGQHVQFLVKNKLLSLAPSPILDAIYASPKLQAAKLPPHPIVGDESSAEKASHDVKAEGGDAPEETAAGEMPEKILVTKEIGRQLSEALEHPEIEVEIERALWQVEQQREKEKANAGQH
ncbi:uncharacterized protein DNG_02483 [Cephalotrichum gorgonifer]|uniref:Mitochondrial K+-H+ exchange-related-domain-containing protein n=1 Tax=Cephalotrichum gorgonifer TaxID=2041049 RepID=A0AAE8MU06_9PEZI|nr:uncharacterized protein DNG_02483 [Cephalotrichum gorgonifer]